MKNNIDKQIDLINKSFDWSDSYNEGAKVNFEVMKDYRRQLKKIKFALEENCSAAVYGESQVGKSYVISSLLSSPDKPFLITDGERQYSFINEINTSGGKNVENETTGIITRFTTRCDNPQMAHYVKIRTLSIIDIILFLTDSYYKDININTYNVLTSEDINKQLSSLCLSQVKHNYSNPYLTEDDILDIQEYLVEKIGNNAISVIKSDFAKTISEYIQHIPPKNWKNIFSLLWNNNQSMQELFAMLIDQYETLSFNQEVYVPYDAVLRDNGSLLDINWLDRLFDESIYEKYVQTVTVYDRQGNVLAQNYPKASLCALIAELTFILSPDESNNNSRTFLKDMDLLDFPGARRRERINEENINKELRAILRRGKVAYLFNKYSSALRINSILFCQHHNQNTQSEMGEILYNWINENVGKDPAERTQYLSTTDWVSPLGIVATKFNMELDFSEINDVPGKIEKLGERWDTRFERTLKNEVVKSKTFTWIDEWINRENRETPFQNIFLLRDFSWSKKQNIFEGYEDGKSGETREIKPVNYPAFRDDLRNSFINHPFVKKHFSDPAKSWDGAATVNNDGSILILNNLNKIAPQLDEARKIKYQTLFSELNKKILSTIGNYFHSDNPIEKIEQTKRISGELRRKMDFQFGCDPSIFGNVIKALMIEPKNIHEIVHKILNNYEEVPQEVDTISWVRLQAGIDMSATYEENKQRLCRHYNTDFDTLAADLHKDGISIDDVLRGGSNVLTSQTDVIVSRIIKSWEDALFSSIAKQLNSYVEGADYIVSMLKSLFARLEMRKLISKTVDTYLKEFDKDFVPNIIADSIALILNNFSASLGNDFMNEKHLKDIDKLSEMHDVKIDKNKIDTKGPKDIEAVFAALDSSSEILKKSEKTDEDIAMLKQLPLYGNYWNWLNQLVMGLILASDMPDYDPTANEALKTIIQGCQELN